MHEDVSRLPESSRFSWFQLDVSGRKSANKLMRHLKFTLRHSAAVAGMENVHTDTYSVTRHVL